MKKKRSLSNIETCTTTKHLFYYFVIVFLYMSEHFEQSNKYQTEENPHHLNIR